MILLVNGKVLTSVSSAEPQKTDTVPPPLSPALGKIFAKQNA